MAHYVERHYNRNADTVVPGYWNPDYSVHAVPVVPCDTREEAEAMEREADEVTA